MSATVLGDELERFIAEHIHSVEQLEVLLLVQRTAPTDWTAARIAADLRTAPSSAASRLVDLTARGFLKATAGPEPRYVYDPSSPGLTPTVIALGQAYADSRITVINRIFAKPPERFEAMRAFADAFRVRKEEK